MAKNPKSLTPQEPFIKTSPGQTLVKSTSPKVYDLLPTVFQTAGNKKLLNAFVENMFQPASLETLNFTVGKNTSNSLTNISLPHPTARRQLEPGLVMFSPTGVETLTADDIALNWGFNDATQEQPVPIAICDLPIDPDKLLNWYDYYWLEEGMPSVNITGLFGTGVGYNIRNDIVGKTYYTLPVQRNGNALELRNGMRVIFQQHPLCQTINGDEFVPYVSTGASIDPIGFELSRYDDRVVGVSVNSVIKTNGVHYRVLGNEIYWITPPAAGDNIHIALDDYYLTLEEHTSPRTWQVEGVGTEQGIRLLGITHQATTTVYSKVVQAKWDQTTIPWDRTEWDGDVQGINAKHYILQKVGAENRNAHSRVNVWYHRDTIQTLTDYLALDFDAIALDSARALRPILEFDNSLELWSHGTAYRPWVNSVETTQANPAYYIGKTAREVNILLRMATETTEDYKINSTPRVLWLVPGIYFNKIINFSTNNVIGGTITQFFAETAYDDDAVVVQNSLNINGLSFVEYYWKNGRAVKAGYRKTRIEQPLFELYVNSTKLSELVDSGVLSTVLNTTIIKIINGDVFDNETGYKLKFSPSTFSKLSDDNIAKNAMYNILYQPTQQDAIYYTNSGQRKMHPGPYSFRRWNNGNRELELSSGWKQAWFRLKSFATQTLTVSSGVPIPLDLSMWANYQWGISLSQGIPIFVHLDNYLPVVDNRAVVAREQPATFKLFLDSSPDIQLVTVNDGVTEYITNVVDDTVTILVPNNASDTLTISLGTSKLTARVIDTYQDPRNPKIKLNGLDVDYSFTTVLTGNTVTAVNLVISEDGKAEITHQGNRLDNDSITAVPGMGLNPNQTVSLNEFSVSKIIEGIRAEIFATKRKNQSWINCAAVKALDGIQMAEHSSMRAAWATAKISPTINALVISRSLSCWKWHRRFLTKLEELHNAIDLEQMSLKMGLNRILEELLVGVTQSSVDALSGVAFTTSGMNVNLIDVTATTPTLDKTEFLLPHTVSTDYYSPDHVYVYKNDQLLTYLIDYSFNAAKTKVVLTLPAVAGDQLVMYQANEIDVFSGIPASPAKLGLGPMYQPKIFNETWGAYSRKFIQRHDGSKISVYKSADPAVSPENYILNKLILELETRIYNGILTVSGARNRQLLVNNYSNKPLTQLQIEAQVEWYGLNYLDYRDRSDFVLTDPWTWNYNGKSWRSIYLEKFGSYNLHTAPWECLGYSVKPTWWDANYSWTDVTLRVALENALRNGITSDPTGVLTTEPAFRRTAAVFPVGTDGTLQDPVTSELVSAPGADIARTPWEIGALGTYELLWRNSPSGAWSNVMYGVSDYNVVSEFFDSNIDPYAKQLRVKNYSVPPKGVATIAPTLFLQSRPTLGLGAILFEGNRELNFLGETAITDLLSISVRLGFGLGGFSDGNIKLKLPFSKTGTNNFVPTEDTIVTLSKGVAVSQLRYTAVRLQKDVDGFRVFGFDPGQRHFKIFRPDTTGQGPNFRQNLATAYGTFVEYHKWIEVPVNVTYGELIANKQDLLTFIMGLGVYQEKQGLVLQDVDARGSVLNWKQSIINGFQWIEENWAKTHYCIIGAATNLGLSFGHSQGMLANLGKSNGLSGKVLFSSGRTALDNELLITRDPDNAIDNISSLSEEQIVFVDLSLRDFQHVVFVNGITKFNDVIVDTVTGSQVTNLKIAARRTHAWTGRPSVNGAIPTETGLLPGFEELTTDIIKSRRPETSAFEDFKNVIARAGVVPPRNSVVSDIILDDTNLFLYQQGIQGAAGTNLSIDALFRNSNFDIPGRVQEIQVNEQWMFDVGRFGKIGSTKIWEIELRKEDFTGRRQIIRFNNDSSSIDMRSDNIIDIIGTTDPRWVTRPNDPNFRLIQRSEITTQYSKDNGWLPSAGIANLIDTDLRLVTLDKFNFSELVELNEIKDTSSTLTIAKVFSTRSFSKFANYKIGDYAWNQGLFLKATENYASGDLGSFDTNNWQQVSDIGKYLPSIWISDFNGYGWNVLQLMPGAYVEEVCPNAIDPNLVESKITFASPHTLLAGEKFVLIGSGDGSLDNLLVVKEIVDDYNILVDAKSTSGTIIYNLVAFKIKSVKFNTDAEWQASTINFLPGMRAYIDYGDTEGSWKIINYIADGLDIGTAPDIVEEYSGPMVASGDLSVVKLINAKTQQELNTLEIFDPYKGLTIDEAAHYIDYRGVADPAVYNVNDLGERDLEVVESWGPLNIGKLWWDITSLRYIEYEQTDDIQYRASNWGEKYADTRATVYEWTETLELPLVELYPYARLDKSSSLSGQIRFSEHQVLNSLTAQMETRYYFWNGNVSELNPMASDRIYSAAAIESIINDPDANGVAWMSPITGNAFILANINDYFNGSDRLILRIEQDTAKEQNFGFSKLISEGFTGDVIEDYFYKRLEASIAGRDNYREIYPIKAFVPGQAYLRGDYILNFNNGIFESLVTKGTYYTDDYPLLNSIDDEREHITRVWTRLTGSGSHNGRFSGGNFVVGTSYTITLLGTTDFTLIGAANNNIGTTFTATGPGTGTGIASSGRDYRIFQAAQDFTAASSVSIDRTARRIVPSGAVGIISGLLETDATEYYAVIDTRRAVPSIRLHPARRYGNQIVPYPQSWFNNLQEARRVMVSAANEFLLTIDTVSKENWDRYLKIYRPLFGPFERDIANFWKYADYVAEGYSPGNETTKLTDFSKVQNLDNTITNFAIVDEENNTIQAYNKIDNTISLVYRKNGTIQLTSSLWDGNANFSWDASGWDLERWDEDGSEVIQSILKALRFSIFVDVDLGYFNQLFFALVKESLVQVPTADWVAKTTYLDVTQTSFNNLNQVKTFYNKQDILVNKYINEVKPYHSKTLDKNQFSVKAMLTEVDFTESIVLTVSKIRALQTEESTALEHDLISTEGGNILAAAETITVSNLTEEN